MNFVLKKDLGLGG